MGSDPWSVCSREDPYIFVLCIGKSCTIIFAVWLITVQLQYFLFSFLMKSVAGWLIACRSCVCVGAPGGGGAALDSVMS